MPCLISPAGRRRYVFVVSLFCLLSVSLSILGAGPVQQSGVSRGEREGGDDSEGGRSGASFFGVDSVLQRTHLSYEYVSLEFDHTLTLIGLRGAYIPPAVLNKRPSLYPQASVETLAVAANRYRTGNAGYQPVTPNGVVAGGKLNLSVGIGAELGGDPVSVRAYLGPVFDWLSFIRSESSVSAARGYRGLGGAARGFADFAVSGSVSLSAGIGVAWYPIGWMAGEHTSFSRAATTSLSLGLRFR